VSFSSSVYQLGNDDVSSGDNGSTDVIELQLSHQFDQPILIYLSVMDEGCLISKFFLFFTCFV